VAQVAGADAGVARWGGGMDAVRASGVSVRAAYRLLESARSVFDEVTEPKRATRRGAWLLGSIVVQIAIVAVVVATTTRPTTTRTREPLVPVKIVGPRPQGLPAPPPPPPPAAQRGRPVPRHAMAVMTPPAPRIERSDEVPPVPEPPAPELPEDRPASSDAAAEGADGGPGSEGGVTGGVAGGAGTASAGGGQFPGPPAPAAPVKFDHTMTPPILISGPPLEYTQQALDREIEGTMMVECLVRVDGTVRACQVLKGLPFMERAVVSSLEQRRYKPATLAGKPLDVAYTFKLRFKLP
jgi:protein TonB